MYSLSVKELMNCVVVFFLSLESASMNFERELALIARRNLSDLAEGITLADQGLFVFVSWLIDHIAMIGPNQKN